MAQIGPNAVLQLLPLIDPGLMARLGLEPPSDHGLMEEEPAHRLHHALRAEPGVLAEAGRRTADYILAHRIPRAAQGALRLLPEPLAARVLSRAIAAHAWTFAGSGRFDVLAPGVFALQDNPLIRGEHSALPLCHWHAAVFQRLFQALVSPHARCIELACQACGAEACRFQVSLAARSH